MLSTLVKFRNSLKESAERLTVTPETLAKLDFLTHLKSNNPSAPYTFDRTVGYYNNILDLSNSLAKDIQEQILQVEQDIELEADKLSDHKFDLNFINPAQRVPIELYPKDLLERITTRIKSYCDWHYPALQIECREKIWTDCMVTADPLYLVSMAEDSIEPVVQSYPAEYQRRLRVYYTEKEKLSTILPSNQYSFILSWNVFEYASISDIELAIKQAWDLLRPGGTFMFSYNNCDLEQSAHLADIYAMGFAHQRKITSIASTLGFTIVTAENHSIEHDLIQNVSWIEIKKPGNLNTSKGHQVLGRILHK